MANKRRGKDIMKLLMSDYKVVQDKKNANEFIILFYGPENSIYETGMWHIKVVLPEQYPYKSPSIGFIEKIFHPNINEK